MEKIPQKFSKASAKFYEGKSKNFPNFPKFPTSLRTKGENSLYACMGRKTSPNSPQLTRLHIPISEPNRLQLGNLENMEKIYLSAPALSPWS